MRTWIVSLAWLLLAPSPAAWASGLFLTDDASLTTAGTAQVEAWGRLGPKGWESWALPAMQIVPNLEATVGIGTTGGGGALVEAYVAQGKTLFRPLSIDDWGVGFAAGATLGAAGRPAGGPPGTFYAYFPLSWSLWGDRLILHHNLGYMFDPGSERAHDLSWNFAAESVLLDNRWVAAAEFYGGTRSWPFCQAGLRWWLVPDLTRLDMTIIGQVNGSAQISLGVSVYGLVQRSMSP